MKCKNVKEWFGNESSYSNIPNGLIEHLNGCDGCFRIFKDDLSVILELKKLNIPSKEDAFWNDFLRETIAKAISSNDQSSTVEVLNSFGSRFRNYVALPVVAAAMLLIMLYSSDQSIDLDDEDIYSSSIDFIFEEHSQASEEYMLNSSSIYAVDEVIPDDYNK